MVADRPLESKANSGGHCQEYFYGDYRRQMPYGYVPFENDRNHGYGHALADDSHSA
ncbi:hypothetical protein ANFP_30980 [Acidithiobacillus ferrooxidans]|nr:hypothetical protein ANFP_30980 [Acidithiobacillus ferrooxidans]